MENVLKNDFLLGRKENNSLTRDHDFFYTKVIYCILGIQIYITAICEHLCIISLIKNTLPVGIKHVQISL